MWTQYDPSLFHLEEGNRGTPELRHGDEALHIRSYSSDANSNWPAD